MASSATFAFATVIVGVIVGVLITRAHRLQRHPAHIDGIRAKPRDVDPGGRVDLALFRDGDLDRAMAAPVSLAKRIFDIAAAIALLACLAPVLAITAIAIKLDSPGPVLYRQRRVGYRGEEFEIFKFRSMIDNAECNGACWASARDKRITRVGSIIRKTRIDEIPQAINILRGEMSFVGPRPERPEFVTLLEREIPRYHDRHIVKPGITGWAQVKYIYTASVEGAREKLAYDLYYIKRFSLLLDVYIIVKTIRVALLGVGSR